MYNFSEFYIGGEWVEPAQPRSLAVTDPASEQQIGTISLGTAADVDRAVAAARAAFPAFSVSSRDERIDLLDRITDAYKKRYADVAAAISAEMGAPIALATNAQAAMGIAHFKVARNILRKFAFEEELGGTRIVREPVGVCGLITPWNWPINQIACKVAPALAAGCTMVLKPSEIAPLDAAILAEILDEAGVPPGVFNLVNGDGPTVGAAIAAHPDIDMVSFTGSTRAGREVSVAAAATLKRVALELGGKSANIILDDADIERAVKHGARACFENTGQSCNAPTRMLVPQALLGAVEQIAGEVARKVVVGDPRKEGTHMGPVVSGQQWEKIQTLIEAGIAEGAKLVAGGPGKPDGIDAGFFVKPTVFSRVRNDMRIAREEIFGPVLSIIPYADEDEAVTIANDTPYGLSGYVSSSDIERARRIAARLRTGMVHLNGTGVDIEAPFGGYKQSGNGREWGVQGFEEYLETKAVMGWSE